ncbi:MAG TPA: ThuA domain-containing protein [Vicinamibacterales bacterium]|nr:ThuA domain-containing protein [Vicinamibacterales bacterium]
MSTSSVLFRRLAGLGLVLCAAGLGSSPAGVAADKRIVLIAGKPSHAPGMHEFRAGCMLFQKALSPVAGLTVQVYDQGWPSKDESGTRVDDNAAFENAHAVLIYADGGKGHPAIQGDRLAVIEALAKRGVGLGFAHYGVEVPAGEPGDAFHRLIGGFYETRFSVNPMWAPKFHKLPNHPVTRGVGPFATHDEWYFNMRWPSDPAMKARITPLLVDTPSDDVRDGPYVSPRGPYDHIIADSGKAETMMWVYERPDGGRGFGFTGGHTHANWGDPNQRRIVLNALLWIAKADVPAAGVQDTIAAEDLTQNLDDKRKR